jgi:N-acetylmuramate 1-kinase
MNIEFHSASPQSTEQFAQELSLWARPGQCILLSGELGSGKSTFARAFIRALAVEPQDFDIPSPTFSIIQSYEHTRVPVAHVDLYRLQSDGEIDELGLDEIRDGHVLLVEWPEKLPRDLSADGLSIDISGSDQTRHMRITACGSWEVLLARNSAINSFVESSTFRGGGRSFLEGDASSRRYEGVSRGTSQALLMDMPKRPDGPIVKDNKPYSAIAHLAESIGAVVGINDFLVKLGFSAPEIYEVDLDKGLALIEPLGAQVFGKMMLSGNDMHEPMMAAVDVIADVANRQWPTRVPIRGGGQHRIENYDLPAFLIEVDLLPTWYWPYVNGSGPGADARARFVAIWENLIGQLNGDHRVWTLRDYHSPNLLWLPERTGVRRVGLIDTQDCVMGYPAYDLVSVLQDARVDIDLKFADELFTYYCGLRANSAGFSRDAFARDFAILGAQRATKILGIFARLFKRDGKPAYLKHMPRVSRYLARNLGHPALADLKEWHDQNLPIS